jgi:hypothetical protein
LVLEPEHRLRLRVARQDGVAVEIEEIVVVEPTLLTRGEPRSSVELVRFDARDADCATLHRLLNRDFFLEIEIRRPRLTLKCGPVPASSETHVVRVPTDLQLGALTLRVVDDSGRPVPNASVVFGAWCGRPMASDGLADFDCEGTLHPAVSHGSMTTNKAGVVRIGDVSERGKCGSVFGSEIDTTSFVTGALSDSREFTVVVPRRVRSELRGLHPRGFVGVRSQDASDCDVPVDRDGPGSLRGFERDLGMRGFGADHTGRLQVYATKGSWTLSVDRQWEGKATSREITLSTASPVTLDL